ncbi:hypothetical protein I6F15_25545 [Bradyrhizobium sp. BRP14]|nr:hypothetical protein [Bradyrhizobium sp. BRP14]
MKLAAADVPSAASGLRPLLLRLGLERVYASTTTGSAAHPDETGKGRCSTLNHLHDFVPESIPVQGITQ